MLHYTHPANAAHSYSVIEHLKKSQHAVIFFYCDYRDDKYASAVQVVYSLLCQILHHFRDNPFGTQAASESLIDELLERSANGVLIDDQQLSILVARIALKFPQCPLVIIDALDECKDIERLLNTLTAWSRWGWMRIFVTSRPLQIIKEKMVDISRKSVISWAQFENGISPDILKFIQTELDACDWLEEVDRNWKERIKSILSEKAEGV